MLKRKNTSNEAGIPLSRNEKKEIMSGYLFQLLQNANAAIDRGKFDKDFCLDCVLEDAVSLEKKAYGNYEIEICKGKLPTKGRFIDYKIGGYLHDDHFNEDEVPVSEFEIKRLLNDTKFDAPIDVRFNIDYPFNGVIFEFDIVDAESVGDILTQISEAFEVAYDFVDETEITDYLHIIEELVFEDSIRVYENGTIEFYVGS